jgi:N-acetylneuraminic acid mutarotase
MRNGFDDIVRSAAESFPVPHFDPRDVARSGRRRAWIRRAGLALTAPLLAVAAWSGVSELMDRTTIPPAGRGGWSETSSAPIEGRVDNVAVWTGSELVVWGGSGPRSSEFLDGAAYDPGVDSWRVLAPTTLETSDGRAAVWTGQEMLVWGGELGDGSHARPDNGAAYDPERDSWRPLPASPYWSLAGHTAIWTGDEMLVWGGVESTGPSGAAYDPARDEWRVLTSAPVDDRFRHVAVWTGSEMIVWGGRSEPQQGRLVADGAAFNPRTETWRTLAPAPIEGREGAVGVWTGEEVVVWGGVSERAHRDGAAYNPDTDQWRRIAAAPIGGSPGGSFAIRTGARVVVFSGMDGVAAYYPATDRWQQLPKPPQSPRFGTTGAWTGQSLLLWGGVSPETKQTPVSGAILRFDE